MSTHDLSPTSGNPPRTSPSGAAAQEYFHDSEELRCLLSRLHEQGSDAWAHDPVAADLMEFVHDRYAAWHVGMNLIRGRRSRPRSM